MRILQAICAHLICFSVAFGASSFDGNFTGRTLRIDYRHTGVSDQEQIALHGMRVEGDWPGSRTRLIDDSNLGKYMIEVADLESHRVLYSRGFASIYGEWETTGEARAGHWRSIEEALRVPEPQRPFHLRLRKRTDDQSFKEIWTHSIDPASRFVDRVSPRPAEVIEIAVHGKPERKVDLVILGDGYTQSEMTQFESDARNAADALFSVEPFRARREAFNVRAVKSPAHESGISRPRAGVFRDSPLGTRYNSFDSERYVLTLEERRWRDVAAAVPYDFVLILVNERKYGGGGIFNLYSTAASRSSYAPYLVVHEFGHHFAGLADEYYTSPVAYEESGRRPIEPWEPNATALRDPDRLKWADLVDGTTPLPTPWDKQSYDDKSLASQKLRAELRASGAPEEELEALFDREREMFTKMLSQQEYSGKVGAFEGAMYEAQGLYRPSADCIMFTRDEVGFCPVCRRAISRVIDMYAE